jgi:4-amino-4-deoxy-L-arabinose transferase-like glycosyltransferase
VLILVPAVVLLLASRERRVARFPLALAGLLCLWAIGLSATRTTSLVSIALVLAGAIVMIILAHPRLSRSTIVIGCIVGALIITVGAVGGAASRLTHRDPPHVGLNFRKDEINRFLKTPATKLYLGQGLAGRFTSKDVNGRPALTGWAHELPVWIALKAGVLGLISAGAALVMILWRASRRLLDREVRVQVLAGAVLVTGLVTMSMTLDRVALPEGVPLLIVGVFLTYSARPKVVSADR